MENDAPDAFDASITAGGQEHQAQHQAMQMARLLGAESERSQSGNVRVLRATSGNGTKRLRNRQETRATTRAGGKTAEAAIKQIASQELQAEKVRIEEWKQNVMQDVMRELQAMKQTQGETMEAQRQSFQMELEKVREELQQVESRSMMLEEEIRSLKTQKQAPQQRPTQNTPASKKTPDATTKWQIDKRRRDKRIPKPRRYK